MAIITRDTLNAEQAAARARHPRDYWWKGDKDNCHENIFAAVEHLRKTQEYKRAAYVHFLRLYSNRLARDLTGEDFGQAIDSGDKIRLNVVKSSIDTAGALIASSRARPQYMSIGGNYFTRKRAERQSRWVIGAFLRLKHYILTQDVFRDSCIFGDGIERPYYYDGNLLTERVFPDELVTDDTDGRTGQPVQSFIVRNVDRHWFAEFWPDDKEAILAADCIENPISFREGLTDKITVAMAWKPASYPGAGDGRYAVAISNKTLHDEPYESHLYPFEVWRYNTSPLGWRGMGLAEELAPIQIEVNYVAQKIQKLMTLATSMIWTEKGSGVTSITNKDWARYEYRGKPPVFQNVSSVSAEYFAHLDRLYARAYELAGISQLAAGGTKPAGIDSGEGLRVYHDIGQKRFLHTGQRLDQYHIDLGEQYLERAREALEDGKSITEIYPDHKDAVEIASKEAMLEKERYLVRVQPASLLPEDPAGRVEMIGRLAQAYPELAQHLVSLMATVPDLEYAVKMVRAPTEIAEKQVDLILEKGKVEAPHPMMDLGVARLVAQRALLNAWTDGIPEERQEALRRYIKQIDKMQMRQQMMAPAVPPTPPPGTQSKPTPPAGMLPAAGGASQPPSV